MFLIDALGAVLSGSLYILLLAQLENVFGMPPNVLYLLAALAGVYALYSGLCYFFTPQAWPLFLKIIAFANLSHCAFTIALVIFHHELLSPLGHAYFAGELLIVAPLAWLEWKVAGKPTT